MSDNSDVFISGDKIYLVFTKKTKVNFPYILYFLYATCNVSAIEKGGAENAKKTKTNYFGTKLFVTFLIIKIHTHT